MALDKMSSHPSANLERSFEIDTIAGTFRSEVSSAEGFGPGLNLEGLARCCHNGQATTAYGHALADLERFNGGKPGPYDREAAPAILWNGLLEPTQSFNQSREHVHALLVARATRLVVHAWSIVLDLNYGSRVRSGVESTITPNQHWPRDL
jgi:hypothetical protein